VTPPAPDEFELSLFGPGKGECGLLHVGDGNWIIIDSCIDRSTDGPVALSYLSDLGLDAAKAIKALVLTHWHDDHIGGAAAILDVAPDARFVCSAALNHKEFMALVASSPRFDVAVPEGRDVAEMHSILGRIRERHDNAPYAGPNIWAAEGMPVFQDAARSVEITALSPSHHTVTLGHFSVASGYQMAEGHQRRRLVARSPNQTAVVLHARVGAVVALLGADLEEDGNPKTGWQAVVSSHLRPSSKASVYKVAHHGSPNSDHEDIWTQLLEPGPLAVMTPYASGRQPRPSTADVERLKACTGNVYCTAPPRGFAPRRRAQAVERTLREVARNRRALEGEMGHIRIRCPMTSAPSPSDVELRAAAVRL
jgi:beta-lactamase superfamily II metal-dependent hydrolase